MLESLPTLAFGKFQIIVSTIDRTIGTVRGTDFLSEILLGTYFKAKLLLQRYTDGSFMYTLTLIGIS